jgi:hypothetical protein
MSQQPLAYHHPEFLESPEARPIRILAEYLEPLRRFREEKIQDTVVFFGSARVDSRERAVRALATQLGCIQFPVEPWTVRETFLDVDRLARALLRRGLRVRPFGRRPTREAT